MVNGTFDFSGFRTWLLNKYSKTYATNIFNYCRKHSHMLSGDLGGLELLSPSVREHAIKSLIALSKYLGVYPEFKERLRRYGIKWIRPDSFTSFLSIINNNHDDLVDWYKQVYTILDDNEKLYLKFMLLSGLRKTEGIQSFNLMIKLNSIGKLYDYFNEELSILEHFRFKQFLRRTKNCYITVVPQSLVVEIASSKPVSYNAIRKYLGRKGIGMRIKELRSFYASYLRKHNILSEEVDILQGRIPKNVFVRHYLKENPKELSNRILLKLTELEQTINN